MRALALLLTACLSAQSPSPVVLELFTSEGCSSCPPADELLRRLEKEPGVIALGFHVDYWDGLGWKDPSADPAYTERQFTYALALRQSSAYTPELVVDGRVGFVGSSAADAHRAIVEAAARPKLPVRILDQGKDLRVEMDGLPSGRRLELMLVLTESGVRSSVLRGENRGRQLEHAAVVRHLERLAVVGKRTGSSFERTVPAAWRSRRLRAVALLQDLDTREILGAAQTDL